MNTDNGRKCTLKVKKSRDKNNESNGEDETRKGKAAEERNI